MKLHRLNKRLHLELLEARQLLAANILVVWNPVANQPDETALFAALTAAGNTVDPDSGPFTAALPTPAQLADVDLILVSRTTTSGDYTGAGETAAWNSLGKPMIVMAPHLARSSHWGLLNSTNIITDQAAPTSYNAFPNPAHPFVTGLTTGFAAAGVQIDSLASTAIPSGATTVATITVSAATHAAIVDIPTGAPSFASGGGNFGERRVFFTLPDYPDKASQDFDDVLTANATSILTRIVDALAVAPTAPSAPTNLTANVVSATQINLFWNDNATNEAEYQVERRLVSGGSFALIATLPAGTTSFSSSGLTANTQYEFRVRAANAGGPSAYSNDANATTLPPSTTTPSVTGVNPGPGSTGVFLDRDIVATVSVPNGGVDSATMNVNTVRIYPTGSPGSPVAAVLNTSGGGDIIVARPSANLAPNTNYTFEVTAGLKDVTGVGFAPFTSTFITGTQTSPVDTSIQFQKVTLANVPIGQYPAVTIGPDGKLYAAGVTGDIFRWDILADGTLGPRTTLTSFRTHNGGQNRLLLGLEFDPASTPNNLIVWATSSAFAFSNSPDFTGRLTRLAGPNLETVHDVLINLPRSFQDHATNQMDFGPDGKLYFLQGSMTAMGAPDAAWGFRNEHLLAAAVLRFDPALWDAAVSGPLDVHTEDGTPYDPFAPGAPLTIYATGVRNAYDLVWHSNGQLYVPTNGSAAGGNTPATPAIPPGGLLPRIDSATNGPYTGPAVPALTGVSTQKDWLFRVVQGGYYGHPNPVRNEYVLNGGNPTNVADPAQVTEYPVGTLPDRNYRGFAFDFGLNRSPDGIIEYKYGGFSGALVGKLLVVRFSSGDDLIVLEPGLDGNIVSSNDAIASFDGFNDPIDLVENPVNGFLYVSQYDRAGGNGTITLLRPLEPKASTNVNQLIFDEVRGGAASAAKTVRVTNTGTGNLTLSGISITGAEASLFSISPAITTPQTIVPGGFLNINVVFNPVAATSATPHLANLRLLTNDSAQPTIDLYLGGLATIGEEGENEPSWQYILDTFRIPIDVGDSNDNTSPVDGIVLPNSNNIQRFVKAGPGPVTIEPIASFVTDSLAQPAEIVGWYDVPAVQNELFRLGSGDSGQHQELNPTVASGVTSFDPGALDFGMYSWAGAIPGRFVYSQNALNTWDAGRQKHVVFPLEDINGVVVPNAYVVGVEEAANNDFQDLVYIIRNVSGVSGDFNEDSRVDGADFLAWQRGLGTASGATRAQGDADFNGVVNAADLAIWKQQIGLVTASVAAATPNVAVAAMAPPLPGPSDDGATNGSSDALGLGRAPATDLVAGLVSTGSRLRAADRSAAYRPVDRLGLPNGLSSWREVDATASPASSPRRIAASTASNVPREVDDFFASLGADGGDDDASALRIGAL